MTESGLVRPLFEGPIDVVADIHGEMNAVRALLDQMGYDADGAHPRGRHLVFLGDLTDRGPDSPAVVRLVGRLVDQGAAQAVLGNHELNLLLGEAKEGNAWFYGVSAEELGRPAQPVPQAPADQARRQEALALFRRLPLALERPDLRVVHACWDADAIEIARQRHDVVETYKEFAHRIEEDLARQPPADEVERKLALQNRNPVKLLTSGPEKRVPRFWANGKWREEGRVAWWNHYGADAPWCVIGHYARPCLPGEAPQDALFDERRPFAPLGPGRVVCLDYAAAKRYRERLAGVPPAAYRTHLAALRWPERTLVFDNGKAEAVG